MSTNDHWWFSSTRCLLRPHNFGSFVGQAVKKTMEIMDKAVGKVLFIDEAYGLNPKHGGGGASFMQEVRTYEPITPSSANNRRRASDKFARKQQCEIRWQSTANELYTSMRATLVK